MESLRKVDAFCNIADVKELNSPFLRKRPKGEAPVLASRFHLWNEVRTMLLRGAAKDQHFHTDILILDLRG